MLNFTLTLKKWNDKVRRHTVRYRVEVFQLDSQRNLLIVPRYGFEGNSCNVIVSSVEDAPSSIRNLFNTWQFDVTASDNQILVSALISHGENDPSEPESPIEQIRRRVLSEWQVGVDQPSRRTRSATTFNAWLMKTNGTPENVEFARERMGQLVLTYTAVASERRWPGEDINDGLVDIPPTPVEQALAQERSGAAYTSWGMW